MFPETGAGVAVTVAPGDAGDRATIFETLPQAGEDLAEVAGATANHEEAAARVDRKGAESIVGNKGYPSHDRLAKLPAWNVRRYLAEPQRGRRRWQGDREAQPAGYGNRRRMGGEHGKALLRRRGELLERSLAHA